MADITDTIRSIITAQPANTEQFLRQIYGRPHTYMTTTDPNKRVFARHMLATGPYVMIRPGRVVFSQDVGDSIQKIAKAAGLNSDELKKASGLGASAEGTVFSPSIRYGTTAEDEAAIEAAILKKKAGTVGDFASANSEQIRYFEFATALEDYYSVAATIASRLYSRLRGKSASFVGWESAIKDLSTNNGGFMNFWADNSTSVSESASSEVGETAIAGMVKNVANLSRQAQFFLGDNALDTKQRGMLTDALNKVADTVGGTDSVTGLRASLGGAIIGMNPMFPEVWKDASFGRSYNLSFKFQSPYGAPGAVYQNVLLPFALLLALVLPVSRGPSTYSTPFVFQLDCPGYFACDLGICTDFSFIKGGSENLWTADGLPRAIDVTMSVKDLYPVLTSSPNNKAMLMNTAMGTFLDNLAGISLLNSGNGSGDVVQRLRASLRSSLQQGSGFFDTSVARFQRASEDLGIAGLARNAITLFEK